MQAIILAAGMGRRLRAYTDDNTKCMVEVNGKRIIDHLFESIQQANSSATVIDTVVLVIGYEGEKLKKYVTGKYISPGFSVEYVENPDYASTNNIYSLYLASDYLKRDDTILLESDILFDHNLIKDLVEDERKDLAVVDKFRHFMDGTMVILDDEERILSFIPKSDFSFESAHHYYKTVNIYKLSAHFSKNYYLPFLEAYIKAYGQNEYYEQVLRVISFHPDAGLKGFKMNGRKWYEVDNAQDLDIASQIFSSEESKSSNLASRYGGYWRFGDIIDFCYLVNPYFPHSSLVEEIKYMFDDLLRNYPSGLDTQNLLAAELFECSKDLILTGNGAAELIKALLELLPGRIGMVFPSFNEYAERISGTLVPFFPSDQDNFSYSVEDIIEWSADIDAFVLINPDNPSGNFIPRDDLFRLVEHFESSGKRLILDESFLDFAVQDNTNGMIDDSILSRYPSLVVIKSISKSYGIPGLRLGVLASGDLSFLAEIRSHLSIWNINSFGEYFLQIYPKHAKKYISSCRKIADERDWFFNELSGAGFLRVIPSGANYLMCEVDGITSGELRDLLIEEYNLFIKDLTGKEGIPKNRNFIRIAVRNREDNEKMIHALRRIGSVGKRG